MSLLSVAGFSRPGYSWHARSHDAIATDMSGRTVLITGATGGLGRAAARRISDLGARTVIVGRSNDRLRSAAGEIGGDVVTHRADLSLMSEIRRLADRILATEDHIDVLINNVGVLHPRRRTTSEGLEATLATNLAGQFLLTNLLLPRIVDSKPARVVNVTSGGMYAERIRPGDLQTEHRPYRGTVAYARSKRGQVILTKMWAERLAGTGVSVHAMHPGWARTVGVERSLPTFNRIMGPLLRTPEEGADTMVWLASADELDQPSGSLWFDRAPAPEHLLGRTRESASEREALWRALVEVTGSDLPEMDSVSWGR